MRKTSPELTAANRPLFAQEGWPWANISAHLPLLYMWTPTTALLAKRCHVRTRDLNWWPPGRWSGMCKLNRCTMGPAPILGNLKCFQIFPFYIAYSKVKKYNAMYIMSLQLWDPQGWKLSSFILFIIYHNEHRGAQW